MPANYKIIGTSRKGGTVKDFVEVARKAVGSAAGTPGGASPSASGFSAFSAEDPSPLVDAVEKAEKELGGTPRRLLLPLDPTARRSAPPSRRSAAPGSRRNSRVVLEKPFGVDLEYAIALNSLVHRRVPRGARDYCSAPPGTTDCNRTGYNPSLTDLKLGNPIDAAPYAARLRRAGACGCGGSRRGWSSRAPTAPRLGPRSSHSASWVVGTSPRSTAGSRPGASA